MAYQKEDSVLTNPTDKPKSGEEAEKWQSENYEWWQNNPMSYDWKDDIHHRKFSKEFYLEIDRRFFGASKEYAPFDNIPFETIIDFESLKTKDVLEIGVGNGSHAGLLARYAKSFTGIDLTDYAAQSTSKRFELFDLKGKIIKMDAEKMEFPDASFDFVWSWGVIHHSSNTDKILEEMRRVLRSGGMAILMVYNRGWWNYYVLEPIWGIFSGNLIKTRSLAKSVQLHTDGAIARYYTRGEWRALLEKYFEVKSVFTLGPKADTVLFPAGKLKRFLYRLIPNLFNLFLARNLGMGSFLMAEIRKQGQDS